MYVLCGMMGIGLSCNLLDRPVNPKRYMSAEEVAVQHNSGVGSAEGDSFGKGGFSFAALLFWSFVTSALCSKNVGEIGRHSCEATGGCVDYLKNAPLIF